MTILTPQLVDDVSFEVFARFDELAPQSEWPPPRFGARNDRIGTLRRLYDMTWDDEVLDYLSGNLVTIPSMLIYVERLVALLMLSEPVSSVVVEATAQPGVSNPLISVCADGLTDMEVFGGAVLLREGDALSVVEPSTWTPVRDEGHIIVARRYDERYDERPNDQAADPQPNVAVVTRVDESSVTTDIWRWDSGRLMEPIDSLGTVEGGVEVVPREPRRNGGLWGRSKLIALFPLALESTRRISRASRVLDLHARPVPVFRESEADARARYNVPVDDSEEDGRKKILEGQVGDLEAEALSLADNLLSLEYLQPATDGVLHALEQVRALAAAERLITGLPDFSGQTTSGDALKRNHLHWFAESNWAQTTLRLAIERLTGAPVDWPHVLDTALFSAPMQGPSQPAAPQPAADIEGEGT